MKNKGKITAFIKKIIEENNLQSEEEINSFFEKEFLNKSNDELDYGEATDEEYATGLVIAAMEEKDKEEAVFLIEEALFFDKKCIDAFTFLATIQEYVLVSIILLKKGIKIGKKKFSKEYLDEHKENLWTHEEIRPFLTAKFCLAKTYYFEGSLYECIKEFENLIRICPGDDIGARDLLMLSLLEVGKFKKFKKYQEQFKDFKSAFLLYNNVFYSFFKDNDLEKTGYLLKEAQKFNPHVVKKLINTNIRIRIENEFMTGEPSEANEYCFFARELWQEFPELIHWLKQNQHQLRIT